MPIITLLLFYSMSSSHFLLKVKACEVKEFTKAASVAFHLIVSTPLVWPGK